MGTYNVNRSITDAFYRYKMPRLQAKVEGKGNGIKTVIVNMADVAKALGRPPTYPTKYFGCELGAQTLVDFKNDRFIVNGSHDATKLQDLLDGFIKRFVLCPECDNPETDLLVNSKKETIAQGCKACGFHGQLQFNHKLNTYILKNPPNLNPGTQGASLTEGKRTRRSKAKQNGDATGDQPRSGSPKSDDDPVDSINPPLPKQSEININHTNVYNDDDWAVDVSEEAVRARLLDLTDGAKNLTLSEDADKTEKERMDIFYTEIKKKLEGNNLEGPQAAKEVLAAAERLDVKSKAPLVLAELLFDDKIHIQIKKYRNLFLRFNHNDTKAQKSLIGGVEQIIAIHKDTLLPKVPALLKLLYDTDILEEKVLLEWGAKVSKKYVPKELSTEIHQRAEPFLTWLKEAEEEEESSEDDIEIEYNDRVRTTPQKPVAVAKPANAPEEEGDDLDIDAI